MTSILYIGNNLQNKRTNVSSIHNLGALLEIEGYSVNYASNKVNKVLRLLDMIFTFFKYSHKVDYVLIDTYSTQNFYFAFFISQLCRIFQVKFIPNLNGGNLPMRLKKNPKLCRMIFNNAYLNVSPSKYLKNAFEGFGYNNVIYVPNTIILKNYEFIDRNFNSINLLWVRSFSEIYNPKLAIKVFKKLKESHINSTLCMVGPDSDGSLIKAKKFAKKLNIKVIFTGKLSKSNWIDLSKDYNIFLNTTNFDNTPVSVIEAMALGLPVISTNVGGMPYLITDKIDGMLVRKNDVDAMVKTVMYISENKDFTVALAKNARKKVQQFDWQVVKHMWFNILK